MLSPQPYDKPLVLRSSFAGFPTKPVNFYEFMTNHMVSFDVRRFYVFIN